MTRPFAPRALCLCAHRVEGDDAALDVEQLGQRADRRELEPAMALRGRNRHCRLADIQRRHFNATARLCGLGADMEAIITDMLEHTPMVIEQVAARVPGDLPEE